MKKLLSGGLAMIFASFFMVSCDNTPDPILETAITSFRFTQPVDGLGIINESTKTIEVNVPFGTDLSNVVGTVSLSEGATISPDISAGVDFSSLSVAFTVTNGAESSTYNVNVLVGPNPLRIALVGDAANVDDLHPDVSNAYNWALTTYAEKVAYIPFSELTAESIETAEVVWFHHSALDRVLPDGATGAALGVIETYYKNGGDLFLTTHASQYLVNLGRLSADWGPTEGGSSQDFDPGFNVNADDWGVGYQYNSLYQNGDNKDNPIFAGLTTKSVTFDGNTYDALMFIDGGSKRDNGYFWFVNNIPGVISNFDQNGDGVIGDYDSDGDGMNDSHDLDSNGDGVFNNDDDVLAAKSYFEQQAGAVVRGSFEWDPVANGVEFFTLVEFEPQGDYQGKAVVFSAGCYEWSHNDGRSNAWRSNVEGITSNIFSYLGVQ